MIQRYKSWSYFFAMLGMLSLIWWQHHMIETGSAINYAMIRWIFSPPFYAFIVTTCLSGGLLFASFTKRWYLQLFWTTFVGLILPAAMLGINYRHFDSDAWFVYGQTDTYIISAVHLLFALVMSFVFSKFTTQALFQLLPPDSDPNEPSS